MLQVSGLTTTAGRFTLGPVSFAIEPGQVAVLTGPVGAGKSTLIECLLGIREAAGSILLNHDGKRVDLSRQPLHERGFGWVPQDALLLPSRTVGWQLERAASTAGRTGPALPADRDAFLAEWRVADLLDRRSTELSGGQAQLVATVRALMSRPRVLLLDEPFSAQDTAQRAWLQAAVRAWAKRHAVPVLHVTHSESEVDAFGDTRLHLVGGQLQPSP